MIEIPARAGVFDILTITEPWWLAPTHNVLLILLGLTVFSGPFIGGLLRWPPAHCLLLAWPVGILVVVVLAGGYGDFPAARTDPAQQHGIHIFYAFLMLWTCGVSGIAYGIGRIWRSVHFRSRGIPDPKPRGRHSWAKRFVYVSIPPIVGMVLASGLIMTHFSALLNVRWSTSEAVYANLLESIIQNPNATLPENQHALEYLFRERAADPETRWKTLSLDHYAVDPDGQGYEFVVRNSPRRVRGTPGRLLLFSDGHRFHPDAGAP